ncbi:hypothetical protein [uncultured Jatrophihabitans sp.]|uniref:hypothetical protein n=1 Tax=uncultured Jatrophihabitans sp. TaxID=1610747 RepID=UPI0035CA665E
MICLPFRLDPVTAARVFDDEQVVRAAGVNTVAELGADLLPGRKKADRVAKKYARHHARLGPALGWQWQGRYVHSTMLYVELVFAIDDLDRKIQARTELCSATNDADQELWDDAA